MKRCIIIAGSPEFVLPEEGLPEAFVIACDRGLEHARAAGIRPDLFVGDLDSTALPPEDVPTLLAPPEKDDTDTVMAVRRALTLGYRDFLLLAGLGGRPDHTLANYAAAAMIAQHGGRCELVGRALRACVFADGSWTLPRRGGWNLSVFSVSDRSEGVCITGAKYPLHDAVLTGTFPVGVSNEFAAAEATVSVRNGTLLVMTLGVSENSV